MDLSQNHHISIVSIHTWELIVMNGGYTKQNTVRIWMRWHWLFMKTTSQWTDAKFKILTFKKVKNQEAKMKIQGFEMKQMFFVIECKSF